MKIFKNLKHMKSPINILLLIMVILLFFGVANLTGQIILAFERQQQAVVEEVVVVPTITPDTIISEAEVSHETMEADVELCAENKGIDYMDYNSVITKYNEVDGYIDDNGIARESGTGAVLVAMGSYYPPYTYYDIVLSNDTSFNVKVIDVKSDNHTDDTNCYTTKGDDNPNNDTILELIVDTDTFDTENGYGISQKIDVYVKEVK